MQIKFDGIDSRIPSQDEVQAMRNAAVAVISAAELKAFFNEDQVCEGDDCLESITECPPNFAISRQ